MEKRKYLNVGCGNTSIEDSIGMDVVKNEYTNPDVIGNILDIPFPDERFEGVIASHLLEHLPFSDHDKAMREMRRVLKSKGKVLIEVPDFEQVLKNYLENYLGKKSYWYNAVYGRGIYEADRHLCGITNGYLTDLLFMNGFNKLEWAKPNKRTAVLTVLAEKTEEKENDAN